MLMPSKNISDRGTPGIVIFVADLDEPFRRLETLGLLQNYGSNAWKLHNYVLEADARSVEAELERARERVTEINRERKNNQVRLPKPLFNDKI